MIVFHISETAMSVISGSALYQQRHLLEGPDQLAAHHALRWRETRKQGRGLTNLIYTTFGGAEEIRRYCWDVGSTFLMESDPETRADGRALVKVARKIQEILFAAGGFASGDSILPRAGYSEDGQGGQK